MADESTERLAGNVRAELARRRITQKRLAEGIGMDEASLSLRLSGAREFRANELDRVARFLDVPLSTLLGEHAS